MKAAFGALIWTAVGIAGWHTMQRIPPDTRRAYGRAESELWRSVISSSPEVLVRFPEGTNLSHGDAVFVLEETELRRVGEIAALEQTGSEVIATLRLDAVRADFRLGRDSRVVQRTQRETFDYCMRVLVTEPHQQEIQALSREFLERHRAQLQDHVQRLLPGLLAASRDFLVDEVDHVLGRHGPELEQLMEDYRKALGEEHALPLMVDEVWPIVQDEIGEPAQILGRALWDRAPLFDFAWRAAWDSVLSDGPEKVEAAWEDFLDDEAMPVLEEHEDLIRETVGRVVRRVVTSEAVRGEIREFAADAVQDPRLRALSRQMLEELLVGNPRLIGFLRERWTDPQLRQEFAAMNEPLQGLLGRIGNLLVFDNGDRDRINPSLTKVLRLLLLGKDKHFLFLSVEDGPELAEGEMLVGAAQS